MTMNKRILLIEDDCALAQLLRDNLEFEKFVVEWSETGRDATQKAKAFSPDLVLLDLVLARGVDAFELCRQFSQGPERTPVIVLTARGEREDKIRGFTVGADDYVVKPFLFEELLARIRAVLRRTHPRMEELRLGDTYIDFRRLRVSSGNREILLTDREFEILRYLAERAGTTVGRDELLRLVWGYSDAPLTRTVDNFIFRLRQKIEPDPRHPKYLRTAYGDGYRMNISD
jgi:DNA-binding response OmpR family regulator